MPDNSLPRERVIARENASVTCDLCNRLSIGLPCAAYPRVYILRLRSFKLLHDRCSTLSEYGPNVHCSTKLGQSQPYTQPVGTASLFVGCLDELNSSKIPWRSAAEVTAHPGNVLRNA